MASGNVKSFFRQKKNSGITKSKAKPSASSKKSPNLSASLGSDLPLISHTALHLDDEYDEHEEEVLKQFDMNMAYGPCLGMTRLARWERANALGLNPPKDIHRLLNGGAKVRSQCLWDGRV